MTDNSNQSESPLSTSTGIDNVIDIYMFVISITIEPFNNDSIFFFLSFILMIREKSNETTLGMRSDN